MASCGDPSPQHRARMCIACAAIYATRRTARRTEPGCKLHGRRAIVDCDACHARTERRLHADFAVTCGSVSPGHRSAGCAACAKIYRRRWWARHSGAVVRARRRFARPANVAEEEDATVRARARIHAALARSRRRAAFECSFCNDRGSILVLEVDDGDLYLLACGEHRGRGGKALAVDQMRLSEGEDLQVAQLRARGERGRPRRDSRPRGRGTKEVASARGGSVGEAYARALEIAQQFDTALVDELRQRARRAFSGIELSEESPMFRERFAKLVVAEAEKKG